ncbi:hypothetical protein HanIR_Chr16g0831761 [Helianthus annuus]|nr:hypothetical protein HanIR_Chr16g0831761 [Helianthus annuus]
MIHFSFRDWLAWLGFISLVKESKMVWVKLPRSFTKEEIEYLIKRIQDGGNKVVKERQITFL